MRGMNVNQFTVQDRQDYQNLKDFIHLRLKQVRGVSELIWDIGNAMVQVDRRGLWWIDMTLVQPVPRMGKGRGKQRKPTREQWADRILKVNERQARKYFKVAECLTRAEVERILAAQASRSERLAAADDVIDNDGALADLGPRVATLHAEYTARFGKLD